VTLGRVQVRRNPISHAVPQHCAYLRQREKTVGRKDAMIRRIKLELGFVAEDLIEFFLFASFRLLFLICSPVARILPDGRKKNHEGTSVAITRAVSTNADMAA